jgi:hypothetical protein
VHENLKEERETIARIIGIIISVIFYFGFSGDIAYHVRKAATIKVHKGLPSIETFTAKCERMVKRE